MKTRKLTHTTMTTVAVLGTTAGERTQDGCDDETRPDPPCALGLHCLLRPPPREREELREKAQHGFKSGFGPPPPRPCSGFLV